MTEILSSQSIEPEYKRRAAPGGKIFLSEGVLSQMIDHADDSLDSDSEIMGLMIGRFYRDEKGTFAEVSRVLTSDLVADEVSVRFDRTAFDSIELDEGECVVGWYHSHLGIGCFMSETDTATQKGVFGEGPGFALVIDPIRKEMKMFDSASEPADMVVMD